MRSFNSLYRGKVEARVDPEQRYRLRLRIAGVHSPEAPLESLPWAEPRRDVGDGHGQLGAPPLGTWVWVEFESGDHQYPVWYGAAWGDGQQVLGKSELGSQAWPTKAFGGSKRSSGPLKNEKDADATKAPDVFGYLSPLHKRLLFDERFRRERVVLGDRHDNMLWVNTEEGVITLEASKGERRTNPRPSGLTLSTAQQALQLYTFKGWRFTVNDLDNLLEVSSPAGALFRVVDSQAAKRIEGWTAGGHRFVLDDLNDSVRLRTQAGFGLLADQQAQQVALHTPNLDQYLLLSPSRAELFSATDLTLKCGGVLSLEAHQVVRVDSRMPIELDPREGALGELTKALDDLGDEQKPERQQKLARACDYDYYKDSGP